MEHNLYEKISPETVRKISDWLYISARDENGKAEFFKGFPRYSPKEFFDDVKYWLGNHYGIYIWDYKYSMD